MLRQSIGLIRPNNASPIYTDHYAEDTIDEGGQESVRANAGRLHKKKIIPDRETSTAMSAADSTCWTVIRAAAAGSPADREELARRYLEIVRTYLGFRWRGSALRPDLDDAVQEVFVECFRQGGALEAAAAGRVPNFRAFLYGVIRNVARRFESRPARATAQLPADIDANEESQSRLFERTWARAIMAEAAQLQRQRAADLGGAAQNRIELLRLRFEEGLPIRTIAERWGVDPAPLHHAYALARQEFRAALLEVLAFHQPGSLEDLEREAAGLLKSLS